MERNRILSVILACATGGGTGAWIASAMNNFWWVGALIGGFVSYLTFEFKTVKNVVKGVVGSTWVGIWVAAWSLKNLESEKGKWKLIGKFWLLSSLVWFMFFSYLTFIIVAIAWYSGVETQKPIFVLLLLWLIGGTLLMSIVDTTKDRNNEKTKKAYKGIIKYGNPFSFCFYSVPKAILWCISAVLWCISKIPRFIILLGKFIKTVFVFIHSDLRLLCFTDGFFGASIGYFVGKSLGPIITYVLVGALSGGIIGVVNYWLVSVKILNVKFSKA